jgi:hypothetical protein
MSPQVSDRTASAVPDELLGQTPRQVYISGSLPYFLTVIVLLFLVGGGTAIGWWGFNALQQKQHRAALRSNGRVTSGRVTNLTEAHGDSYVYYTFTVDGARYFGRAQIGGDFRGPLHKSDEIAIRFLPSDPAINHPDAWEWSMTEQLLPILFFVFFLGVTVWGLAYIRRERELARNGKPVQGIVTNCAPQKDWYQVAYEFRTEDGEHMSGASDSQDSYETGQKIWILYLSKRPHINHAYPLSDYEIPG